MFSHVFFATACIADFHISFASKCSSKYIGVREIRHTGKVTSRFAHGCPSLWAYLPNYVGHLYPRLWARLPKAMGIRTHVRGYGNPCTWVWVSMGVGCFSALLTRAWQ